MNLPPGSVLDMTAKASTTTTTFVKWLDYFAKFKTPGKLLLIFCGAFSHLDYSIVEAAESHGVILFCLPSNTTHELLIYWTNKPHHRINKAAFVLIFSKVWPKTVSPSNIMAGFWATGIYPYDPNIKPDSAFAD